MQSHEAAPTLKKQWCIRSKEANIDDYYEINYKTPLGTGAFGTVLKGRVKGMNSDNAWRAIKKIPKRKVKDPKEFANEIEILQKLDHPNIIKLFETFEDARNVYMVTELCTGGELFDKIIQKGFFSEEEARCVFSQIMLALNYCHSQKIAHRDLKPENFLLLDESAGWPLKLIDFGLSFMFNTEKTTTKGMGTLVGTSYYMAPEVMQGRYDQTCDIWSAGVILYILVSSVPPFNGETDEDILEKVKLMKYTFDIPEMKNVSAQLKDLISKILVEPDKRPTAAQILDHPWVKSKSSTEPLTFNFNALKTFCSYSKFKKLAVTLIATQLQEKDILELGKVFKQIDKNGDGMISLEELKHALETQKDKATLGELKKLMDCIDNDHSGSINYTEFIASCLEQSTIAREDNMLMAFRMLDVNGDGKVSPQELRHLLEREDFKMSSKQIEDMISSCDKNNDGAIDYKEFIGMMTQK